MKNIPRSVIFLGLVSFFNDIAAEMIYPIVPIFLTTVLGVPVSIMGTIEGIAEATASLMKFVSGYISDKVGKRKIFVIAGYSFGALSKLLIGLASTWHFVLFARFIDRLGKGIRTSARDSILLQYTTDRNKGLIFGFHRAFDSAGAVLGPIAALILLSLLKDNLRLIFFLAFIPSLVGVLLLVVFVKEKRSGESKASCQTRFYFPGRSQNLEEKVAKPRVSILETDLSQYDNRLIETRANWPMNIQSGQKLRSEKFDTEALQNCKKFVSKELQIQEKIGIRDLHPAGSFARKLYLRAKSGITSRIYRLVSAWQNLNPSFKLFFLISLLFSLGNSSDAFLILRSKNLGLSTGLVIVTYMLYNLSQTIFAAPAGRVADKIGARKVFAGGLLVFSFVYFLFGIINNSFWLWVIFPIYGVYIAATDGVSKAYISQFIKKEESGTYFGFYQTGTALASFFASFIAGLVWTYIHPSAAFFYGSLMAILAFLILAYGKFVKRI